MRATSRRTMTSFGARLAAIGVAAFVIRVGYLVAVARHQPLGFDSAWYLLVSGPLAGPLLRERACGRDREPRAVVSGVSRGHHPSRQQRSLHVPSGGRGRRPPPISPHRRGPRGAGAGAVLPAPAGTPPNGGDPVRP